MSNSNATMEKQAQKAKGKFEDGMRAAGEAAYEAGGAVQGAIGTAQDAISSAASYVGDKADSATEAVGSGMKSLGHQIRDKGPESGMLGKATSAVAGALESTGEYMEDKGLSGMGQDVTNLVRRYPIASVCVGLTLGYLLARALRS